MATQKKEKQALKFLDPAKVLQEIGLEEGMQVADFGAGSGYFAFQASEMIGKNGNLYAMDVQKAVIDHLNKEIKHQGLTNFKTVWTDLEMVGHNPIPAGNIDLVLIVNMLFQSTKHNKILQEVCRELKPGGRLAVIDWKREAAPFGPPPDDRVDLEKFKEIAYTLGLNKIKEFAAGPYHFGIVFRK